MSTRKDRYKFGTERGSEKGVVVGGRKWGVLFRQFQQEGTVSSPHLHIRKLNRQRPLEVDVDLLILGSKTFTVPVTVVSRGLLP